MKQIKNNFKKGFTLIELLVVISIISLLSSIVLSSVQDARNKAKDKAVISQLWNMRLAVEQFGSGSGEYGFSGTENDCTGFINESELADFQDQNNWPAIGGGNPAAPECKSNAGSNEKITAFSLWHATSDGGWCVDSSGNSVSMATAPEASVCSGGGGGSNSQNYSLIVRMIDMQGNSVPGDYDISPNSGSYSPGTEVTVMFYPDGYPETIGYPEWINGCSSSEYNICRITMDSDKEISAVYDY